ncbi:hypothetical protein JTB14_031441 [Gonioctena quinquepunctata]|nr:hypothetical protein JTB14_031441 [Gonioctena quinquepunctata]
MVLEFLIAFLVRRDPAPGHILNTNISSRHGYCAWREQYKPTFILEDLCKKWHTDPPEYGPTWVRIGFKEFASRNFSPCGDLNYDREILALTALRRWNEMPVVGFTLVPEHVETRSLFDPSKPGIEQAAHMRHLSPINIKRHPIKDRHLDEVDLSQNNASVKTLGLSFNITTDNVKISSLKNELHNSVTERQVLSCICKFYDPLGFEGPVLVASLKL